LSEGSGAAAPAHAQAEDEVADVVCVGAGLGGLAAAVRATHLGLSVMLLEAAPYFGGGAAYSGGLCWIPGVSDEGSIEAADAYLTFAEGEQGFADKALRRDVLTAMRDAALFYIANGVCLEVVPGNPDALFPQAPGSVASGRMFEAAIEGGALGPWRRHLMPSPHYRIGLTHHEAYSGHLRPEERSVLLDRRRSEDVLTFGAGLTAAFAGVALASGTTRLLLEHRVRRLLDDGRRVTGVEAEARGRAVRVRAKQAVLIATGGYGWAPDAADLEGLPDFVDAGPPTIAGDHLNLATALGAAIVRGGGPQFCLGAVLDRRQTHPGSDRVLCRQLFDVLGMPHTLVVNRDGRRFGDESYYVGINEALRSWDPLRKCWTNFPCYLIFDEQYRRKYAYAGLGPEERYLPEVVRADSLVDLAAALGIDPRLVSTVEDFNAEAALGRDPRFGRGSSAFVRRRYGDQSHDPNANLGPVCEPPFYGLPLRLLGTGMCTFGLWTDGRGRVLRRGGSAIEGLYATGNAVATTEFRSYITGYANSRNIAMAYVAMTEAAAADSRSA
jgi:3-oxosteroid 1-dehydrogenase